MELIVFSILMAVGLGFGTLNEKRHYKKILEREDFLGSIPVITGRWQEALEENDRGQFVHGSVVVGSDYFKTVAAQLKSLFGGRLKTYESLLDRGRREAIIRMKEQARQRGAYKIINLRIETSSIGDANSGGKRFLPCVEVHCYATAISQQS